MKIIDVIDEVWMWVNQKYVISRIVWKMYSFEINNCFYLADTDDGQLNWRKN